MFQMFVTECAAHAREAMDLKVKSASSLLQLEIWLAVLGLLVGHCLF